MHCKAYEEIDDIIKLEKMTESKIENAKQLAKEISDIAIYESTIEDLKAKILQSRKRVDKFLNSKNLELGDAVAIGEYNYQVQKQLIEPNIAVKTLVSYRITKLN